MISTGNGHINIITLDFTLYISYKTTFFKKIIMKLFLNGFLIIFAPEEAEACY
jgi:hypothetical protein